VLAPAIAQLAKELVHAGEADFDSQHTTGFIECRPEQRPTAARADANAEKPATGNRSPGVPVKRAQAIAGGPAHAKKEVLVNVS